MTNQELKDKNYTNYIESEYLKDLPDLSVGESVRLGIQIVEGNRERIFLLHSPKVVSIEKKKLAKVRRSKLYFLRNLPAKTRKLKQKF
jgi:large subunit ribosomal protein L19